MIVTVTANPSVDRTYHLTALRPNSEFFLMGRLPR